MFDSAILIHGSRYPQDLSRQFYFRFRIPPTHRVGGNPEGLLAEDTYAVYHALVVTAITAKHGSEFGAGIIHTTLIVTHRLQPPHPPTRRVPPRYSNRREFRRIPTATGSRGYPRGLRRL